MPHSSAANPTYLIEDPLQAPPAHTIEIPTEVSGDSTLLEFYLAKWVQLRTRAHTSCTRQDFYNIRLVNHDLTPLSNLIQNIFYQSQHPFRVSASLGFILENRETGQFRYWHSSQNNPDLISPRTLLVSNLDDLNHLLDHLQSIDIPDYVKANRPSSAWVIAAVTNVSLYVHKLPNFLIGGEIPLPKYYKTQMKKCLRLVSGLDNLCFFRCLSIFLLQ